MGGEDQMVHQSIGLLRPVPERYRNVSSRSSMPLVDDRYADNIATGSMNRHAGKLDAITVATVPPRSAQKTYPIENVPI